MSKLRIRICATLLCVSGCLGDGRGDAAKRDSGLRDSAVGDADAGLKLRDAGHFEAGGPDANRPDADTFDGSMSVDDGGSDGDGGPCDHESAAPNLACPTRVGPLDGCYQQKGQCCFRRSNSARREVAALAGATSFRREYRVQFDEVQNHPQSLGLAALAATAEDRLDREQQSLLWAFEGATDAAGNDVSGAGFQYVGPGTYNCDGTYSFYGDSAAPSVGGVSSDTARWAVTKLPATIDVSKTGVARSVVAWADRESARQFAYTPYLWSGFTLDWELVTIGFQILDFGTTADEDCAGGRGPAGWTAQGDYIDYVPMLANDRDVMSTIDQSQCQLMAFGIVAPVGTRPQCEDARCTPGTASCPWVKLPDSLCPLDAVTGEVDAVAAAKWGCHVGFVGNPDGAPTHCAAKAPSTVLDLDVPGTSEGQCCDPLGQSLSLPACNAWIVHHAFVAAAAEITDQSSNALQSSCLL